MEHVLLIDDNLTLCQCIKQALAEAGYGATLAGTVS